MKNITFKLLKQAIVTSFIFLSLPSYPAFAATWYVDNAVPASGNGQTWSTAYKNFSNIAWINVKPGDTIFISGGPTSGSKTYTESWAVGSSGAAGTPIVIAVDAANPSHNGKAVFDYDALGDKASVNGISITNRSYLTFDGNVNGQNHLAIKNLRNIIDRTNATCLTGSGSSSIIVDHVDFDNCNNGIRLWSGAKGSGSEVKNSNFTKIRGDVAIMLMMNGSAAWDSHKIHDNSFELLNNNSVPPGGTGTFYVGPDGIQPGDGVSFYNNKVKVSKTTLYTSNQHIDDIQFGMSKYLKVYNNEFVNVGDSVIDLGTWGTNIGISNIWIFNNVFRIETLIDGYPQYIRLYANPGNISSINNLKIFNNLFLDGGSGWPVIDFSLPGYGGNPTGSGNEIKNNIFYNTSGISIPPSTGFTATSFDFSSNVYYPSSTPIDFRGTKYTATTWISAQEPTGKTVAPTFVSYALHSPSNDLHLAATDKAAIDNGEALDSFFNTDKDLTLRPQGAAWDIGPYEFISSTAVTPPQPPTNLHFQ